MLEMQLPLLLRNASLNQAYRAMRAMERSGVLLSARNCGVSRKDLLSSNIGAYSEGKRDR